MHTISGFFNWISERWARMQNIPPLQEWLSVLFGYKATTLPPMALSGKKTKSNKLFGKVFLQYPSWIA